jgi:uncharacterized protein (DUF433 family)
LELAPQPNHSKYAEYEVGMNERILVDPTIHFGKPTIAGTRITVQDVLELLNDGISFEQITTEYYPDLTNDDVKACLDFAISLISAEDIKVAA